MRKAIKKPTDDFDQYSLNTGIDFTGTPEITRQEFAAEADINTIMRKFGADALTRPVTWGDDVDWDLDLSLALEAKQHLEYAWTRLPEQVRQRYHNWNDVQRAADLGELDELLQPTKEPPKPSPTEDIKPE